MAVAVAHDQGADLARERGPSSGDRPWLAADLRPRRDPVPGPAGRGHDRCSASTTRPGARTCSGATFSLDAWMNPLGRPGLPEAVRNSLVIAFLSTIVATDPRDAHRAGPRALRLPRPGRHQPADLPAHVDAGDRPRRLAADDVHRVHPAAVHARGRRLPAEHPHDHHRPHHVQHQLRGGDREGPAVGLPAPSRGGGDGPRGERVDDLLEGHLPAHPARASRPRRCWPSACRSTTTSSPASRPARRRPSRCSSTARSCAASRSRSTSSGPSSSSSPSASSC